MRRSGSYVAPVQATVKRYDQGIDYQGKPGTSVVAIGLARVDAVKDDPGGFGKAVYYTLLDGPLRGQQIYVGHAQPDVTAGKIVQAGDPVATLSQQSLGNAAGLPGWTEIGFAKNGAPEPGSSQRFAKFVKNLGAAPAPAQTAPTPAQPTVDTSVDSSLAQPVGPPDPTLTHPQVFAPGSGGLEDVPASLWRTIISQPYVNPDTLAYAQQAQVAAGS